MRWVPSEINVADQPSRRGIRPSTENQPHHHASRFQRHVREPLLGHGAPARKASQKHPSNQIASPSCGHRRSGAQRRGIKKVLARARATKIARGKKERNPSDEPRAHVRGPNDAERLRAVALPVRVFDTEDHRHHLPTGTVTDLGAGYSNDPRPGDGQAQRSSSMWKTWSKNSTTQLFGKASTQVWKECWLRCQHGPCRHTHDEAK